CRSGVAGLIPLPAEDPAQGRQASEQHPGLDRVVDRQVRAVLFLDASGGLLCLHGPEVVVGPILGRPVAMPVPPHPGLGLVARCPDRRVVAAQDDRERRARLVGGREPLDLVALVVEAHGMAVRSTLRSSVGVLATHNVSSLDRMLLGWSGWSGWSTRTT